MANFHIQWFNFLNKFSFLLHECILLQITLLLVHSVLELDAWLFCNVRHKFQFCCEFLGVFGLFVSFVISCRCCCFRRMLYVEWQKQNRIVVAVELKKIHQQKGHIHSVKITWISVPKCLVVLSRTKL